MDSLARRKAISVVWLAILLALIVAPANLRALPPPQQTATPAPSVLQETKTSAAAGETGKFILHRFEQPIGEGNSPTAKIDFKFTDRGSPVPLTAAFKAAPLASESAWTCNVCQKCRFQIRI